MIKILLTAIGFLLTPLVIAQPEKRFDYQLSPFGNYKVTPIFDTIKMEGKRGFAQFLDQEYVDSMVHKLQIDQLFLIHPFNQRSY